MTRAEFLGKILGCDPGTILIPLQDTKDICKNERCGLFLDDLKKCKGCPCFRSYWNSEMTLDEMDKMIDLAEDIRLDK